MRIAAFALLSILSVAVAAYALFVYAALPVGALVHPDMRAAFEAHRLAILTHVFGASIALIAGPLQFITRLRTRWPALHRWLGRLYLGGGVAIGGAAGVFMAFHAFGGVISKMGFGFLAVAWLFTGLRAYLAIRRGEVAAHRAWMIRNFALSFAAVTLRMYMPASVVLGIEFADAYPIIAWLCWVPNALFAELLVNRPSIQRAPAPA